MKGGSSLIFLVIVVIVFYFLLILPQRRQQRKKAEMMKQLAPGSRVMTASGIYGDVVEIDGDIVIVEIAEGVEIEMDQRAIVRVISEGYAYEEEEPTENEDGHVLGAPDEVESTSDVEGESTHGDDEEHRETPTGSTNH